MSAAQKYEIDSSAIPARLDKAGRIVAPFLPKVGNQLEVKDLGRATVKALDHAHNVFITLVFEEILPRLAEWQEQTLPFAIELATPLSGSEWIAECEEHRHADGMPTAGPSSGKSRQCHTCQKVFVTGETYFIRLSVNKIK